jgi:long-chain acyl-CoA synthetase
MFKDEAQPGERPWARLTPAGCGADFAPEFGDMLSLFRAAAAARPDWPAVLYFDGAISYAELDASSDALAVWLTDQGVRRGDRVAIILQNIPQFVMMAIAAWKVGAAPLPGNPMYRAGELTKVFADAEPAAILCQEDHLTEVRAAATAAALSPAILTTSGRAFQTRNDARVLPPAGPPSGEMDLLAVLGAFGGRRPAPIALDTDSLGLLLYTSGTTGQPKGAMLRHSSLAFNSQIIRDWCGLSVDTRILAIAPFFHITGFVCHIGAAFSARASMVAHYRFDPSLVVDAIVEHRPTFTIGAITAFNALMQAPGVTPTRLASLKTVYSGGAAIPPALAAEIKDRLGLVIHSSYGMTETTSPTHLAPLGADIPIDPESGALSIGIPVAATKAMIVNALGEPLPPGEVGEVVMAGPQIMAGYWRKPEATAEALRDGFMYSGDVGFMNAAGWFFLLDRKKDMINASGFKVWPREVEDVLYAHPAVREAAVIGLPDPYRGETVKAFVSLKAGATVDAAELAAHCRERLAAYKIPRAIDIIEEVPKTVTGKIQRAALRRQDSASANQVDSLRSGDTTNR